VRILAKPSASSSAGGFSPSSQAIGDGATVCQPFGSDGAICLPPSHGFSVDALRPAWPSWIAIGMSDQRRTLSSTRAIAASLASDHSPTSP
jgi:hypothetical protein